ncbi:hypothetical protein BYT27DRAFT_7237478 [Phlegmacium glaucopus]|nr:hypothetical protein BYT27DRAFT_7237478 [Phlegmacium glaucopus]
MFAAYNTLPTVDVADERAEALSSVRQKLCNILQEYQLQNVFSVRLVHKHFDMLEDELPVFSRIPVAGVAPVIIMGPLPSPLPMSTTSAIDITEYKPFIDRVIKTITEEKANHIFGLVALSDEDSDDALSEFELPELRTTVMVPQYLQTGRLHADPVPRQLLPPIGGIGRIPILVFRATARNVQIEVHVK